VGRRALKDRLLDPLTLGTAAEIVALDIRQWRFAMRRLPAVLALVLLVAALAGAPPNGTPTLSASASSSTTATYRVYGTVACPSAMPVVGVWMRSTGGGSQFLSWTPYPGASSIARIYKAFTTNLPTSIYLNVGCGGKPAKWRSSSRTPTVSVSSGSVLYLNTECNGLGSCAYFPKENNTPPAPSYNPAADSTQCTWRAAEFWKKMTGRYPNWRGNAGYWDDNAATTGWAKRSWPRPDSLAVWQPTASNPAGHVGYVADTRVSNGVLQMKIYDRNYDFRGTDRNGVWLNFVRGMKFIVVPPRRA
jgi:hypothetical protein